VSDYVQALTHELKSPIAAIQGAAELIEEDMPPETRKRFMDNIRNESTRMQELIERLLELASLEYRPELESSETLDINELLHDVIDSLEPMAQARQVSIELSACENSQIHGDPFLLSKAFANILKNAIEFSPPDSRVSISSEAKQNRLIVSICDQGGGVPDYAREKVFDRFFSLPRPDGRKGSGLGLSFVREIAALHRASVMVEDNRLGSGICVKFVMTF
jgi:two-component system sensor histidine kinase CreC